MTTQQILTELGILAPEIHETNVLHGFWEDDQNNRTQKVALICGEWWELQEAHRKGKILMLSVDDEEFFNRDPSGNTVKWPSQWKNLYDEVIKGTIDEEAADTVIRIVDFCTGFKEPIYLREYRKSSTGNFSHDMLRVNHYILQAYHNEPGKDWGYVLAAIIEFCRWHNIDLLPHIEWKLKYNKLRPYKHGKAY
jgi:hypothetical protein